MMDKDLLREYKKKERDLLSERDRKIYSHKIFESITKLPEYLMAQSVM